MGVIRNFVDWYFRRRALPYWCIVALDCFLCFVSGFFMFWLFENSGNMSASAGKLFLTLSLYMVCNLFAFRVFRTYSGIVRYSSFVDLRCVAYALCLAFLLSIGLHYAISVWDKNNHLVHFYGRQVLGMYVVALILMWSVRVLIKNVYDIALVNNNAMRTLVYGVQGAGVGLAKNMRNQKPSRFVLKGFLSDNVGDRGKMIMGESVYPINDNLREVLHHMRIQAVIVSPLRDQTFRNNTKLQDLLLEMGIKIYVMANPLEWNETHSFIPKIHEVSIDDLLPRDEIQVDMESACNLLRGKKILITGSAGSIGSEMVRQIAEYKPAGMVLIDQAETPQHEIRLMMAHDFPEIQTETVVTSICKKFRMEHIFSTFRPDYVFHAAAYKHVPMMEDNPSESIQNNVEGTRILADLSVKYAVKKFVMISTDKAVNPTNVMGCSKRICEIYVQSLDRALKNGSLKASDFGGAWKNVGTDEIPTVTQFVTTRFGNVLGSNGSVIPLFKKQLHEGGPLTVTSPDIVRFFMLIPEACKLVLEAGTKSQGGEIFVFDMGKPVKIADLAKRMIRLSGAEDIQIEYTGLRAGEKLYEEVLSTKETTRPSFHEKIRIASVREYGYDDICRDIAKLDEVSRIYDDNETVRLMKQIVPEFKSKNNSAYEAIDEDMAKA